MSRKDINKKKDKSYISVDNLLPEVIEGILSCYCLGMSEFEISSSLPYDHELVRQVLNNYTKYL